MVTFFSIKNKYIYNILYKILFFQNLMNTAVDQIPVGWEYAIIDNPI